MSPGNPARPAALTLDELRARIRVAGIPIPEERLEVVRAILSDALAPLRALDSRAVRALEPAVTFDAGAAPAEAPHGR
jgi:hypothetical protein